MAVLGRQLCQVRPHIHLDGDALKWLHFARHIEAHLVGKGARFSHFEALGGTSYFNFRVLKTPRKMNEFLFLRKILCSSKTNSIFNLVHVPIIFARWLSKILERTQQNLCQKSKLQAVMKLKGKDFHFFKV